jgi:PST family polysaccharide transporter
MDNVLIGRFVGLTQLGLYTRAYALVLLPIHQINQPLASVAIPILSRLRDQPDRYRRYYCTALQGALLLLMPIVSLLIVMADDVILLMLGPAWRDSIILYRTLAIGALLQVLLSANGWLYVSTGRTRQQLRFALVSRPLTIVAFAIGVRWGAEGVALAYSLSLVALTIPSLINASRDTPVSLRDIAAQLPVPCLVSCSVASGALIAKWAASDFEIFGRMAITLAGAAAGVAVMALLLPPIRRKCLSVFNQARVVPNS